MSPKRKSGRQQQAAGEKEARGLAFSEVSALRCLRGKALHEGIFLRGKKNMANWKFSQISVKRQAKKPGLLLKAAVTAALAAGVLFSAPSFASAAPAVTSGNGDSSISIGNNVTTPSGVGNVTVVGEGAVDSTEHGDGSNATAFGANTTTSENGTAVGNKAAATWQGTTAIGAESTTASTNATAVGYQANAEYSGSVAAGYKAHAGNSMTVAVGQESTASGSFATAVGYQASATGGYSQATGFMSQATGGGSAAYGYNAQATGASSAAYGYNAKAAGMSSSAYGESAQAAEGGSSAFGTSSAALAQDSTAIGRASHATVIGGVTIGAGSTASTEAGEKGYDAATGSASTKSTAAWRSGRGAVSVGDAYVTRQITGLAAGTQDTDAVNVAQLKSLRTYSTYSEGDGVTITDNADGSHKISIAKGTMDQINKNTSDIATNKGNIDKNTKDIATNKDSIDKNTKDIATNKDNIDKNASNIETNKNNIATNAANIETNRSNIATNAANIETNRQNISRLGHEVRQVGAGAAALAGLHPVDFDPDSKWNVAVSGGSYKDQQALALGAFYHPNDDTLLSVGSTLGNNDNMVTVGASFKLGSKGNIEKINPSEAAKEITELKKQVAELKADYQQQKEINEQQQKLIEKLAAKVGV